MSKILKTADDIIEAGTFKISKIGKYRYINKIRTDMKTLLREEFLVSNNPKYQITSKSLGN